MSTVDFMGVPAEGFTPLTVQFTDLSSPTPTSWLWGFGDGGTSTEQNPQHIYTAPGVYDVQLTATFPPEGLLFVPFTGNLATDLTPNPAPAVVGANAIITGAAFHSTHPVLSDSEINWAAAKFDAYFTSHQPFTMQADVVGQGAFSTFRNIFTVTHSGDSTVGVGQYAGNQPSLRHLTVSTTVSANIINGPTPSPVEGRVAIVINDGPNMRLYRDGNLIAEGGGQPVIMGTGFLITVGNPTDQGAENYSVTNLWITPDAAYTGSFTAPTALPGQPVTDLKHAYITADFKPPVPVLGTPPKLPLPVLPVVRLVRVNQTYDAPAARAVFPSPPTPPPVSQFASLLEIASADAVFSAVKNASSYTANSIEAAAASDSTNAVLNAFHSGGWLRAFFGIGGALLGSDYDGTTGKSRLYASSDHGVTWTVAADAVTAEFASFVAFDVGTSTGRLHYFQNISAGIYQKALTTDNVTIGAIDATGIHLSGGLPIDIAALMAGSTTMVAIGHASTNPPVFVFRFESTDDGATWTQAGQITVDPADPHPVNPASLCQLNTTSIQNMDANLSHISGRWFLRSQYGVYYTDDAAGLTGWRHAFLQLGEDAPSGASPVLVTPLLQFGSLLVVVKLNDGSVSYSSDNGTNWTVVRPSPFTGSRAATVAFVAGSNLCIIPNNSLLDVVHCTNPAGTWTETTTNLATTIQNYPGLPLVTDPAVTVARASVDGTNLLSYTADGITWSAATGISP